MNRIDETAFVHAHGSEVAVYIGDELKQRVGILLAGLQVKILAVSLAVIEQVASHRDHLAIERHRFALAGEVPAGTGDVIFGPGETNERGVALDGLPHASWARSFGYEP